jgi:hypothetical protein
LQCARDVAGRQHADHSSDVVDDNSAPIRAAVHTLEKLDERILGRAVGTSLGAQAMSRNRVVARSSGGTARTRLR